jgi:hypothetical protein
MAAGDSQASFFPGVHEIHGGCALFTVNSRCGWHMLYYNRPGGLVVPWACIEFALPLLQCLCRRIVSSFSSALVLQINDCLPHAISARTTTVDVPACLIADCVQLVYSSKCRIFRSLLNCTTLLSR